MKKILLVDTSSILHMAKHSGSKNLKHKEKSTYVIFGFLLKLHFLMSKVKPNAVVFAKDSLFKNSLRLKLYPTYKQKRNTTKTQEQIDLDNIAYPQFQTVENEILPDLGYSNAFKTEGYEADDIIASICKTYTNCEIVIVTSDQDMYQLITKQVCILNPRNNQYFTLKNFNDLYDIEPKMWKRVKVYSGCTSDEVKGIKGVAEKTAIKYIKGELPPTYKAYQAIISKEGKDIIKRNKPLIILPFKGTPKYRIKRDNISKLRLFNIATKYGFKSILIDIDNWIRTLKTQR